VHASEVVISDVPPRGRSAVGLDWPGRGEGLSDRESEILALITQGKSDAEVAKLTYLSPNTVKSYIRTVYRKIDVGSRTQAVLWGVKHGFTPDHNRIQHWRGRPLSCDISTDDTRHDLPSVRRIDRDCRAVESCPAGADDLPRP
jgi:DNA-binding CsgD family transcriptional regulator